MDPEARQAVDNWLKNYPFVFRSRWDGDALTLCESATGKTLAFDAKNIVAHRLKEHPQSGASYLNLVFENGREIVLCHAGLAFAPDFASTGPLPDAPPVACMTDYRTLLSNLDTLTRDPSRKGEALRLFNVLISILDGAKAVGLDVGPEEEALDRKLSDFEAGF